jgi:hypothetical protein
MKAKLGQKFSFYFEEVKTVDTKDAKPKTVKRKKKE